LPFWKFWTRHPQRIILTVLLCALVIAAAVDNISGDLLWQLRAGIILLAALGLTRTMKRRHTDDEEADDEGSGCGPAQHEIEESAGLILNDLADHPGTVAESSIVLFTQFLMGHMRFARVTEDVRLQGDLLSVEVSSEVSLDSMRTALNIDVPEKGLVVVPIRRTKSVVHEHFEAWDSEDNRLTPLSRRLTDGWLAWGIKGLYEFAYGRPTGPTRAQNESLFSLIGLVCRTDVITPDLFSQHYRAIIGDAHPKSQSDADLLRSVCEFFAGNTVSAVAVDVERTKQFLVKYRYTTVAERLATRNNRYRTVVGIRPFRYQVPIDLAYSSDVYDLRITGPDSQFVYRHYLIETTADRPATLKSAQLAQHAGNGIRLDRNEGASYTGLHTRGLQIEQRRDIACVVDFEEIPPGALRRALVISTVCTLVTVAFAFAVPTAVKDSQGTDMAALLLAAPGLAATLVGLSPERLQHSSLTAFGGLVMSALLSFTASVIYLAQTLIWKRSVPVRLTLIDLVQLPLADAFWLGIAGTSLCITVYLAAEGWFRMHRYLVTLRRRPAAAPPTA
jgi:hypothetical protein